MTGGALDDRKAAILRAVVTHYVTTGEPVGSKTIVEAYRLGVSPATVRNEMGALEEAGYIYHPHTSAGRIPTDAGYRYFVDASPARLRLPADEAQKVRVFFGEPKWELEDALRQTAALLSSLTHHAAVVFAPALDKSVVRHLELLGLSGGRAMVVAVTDTGRVENHVLLLDPPVDDAALHDLGARLTALVVGKPLEDVAAAIRGAVGSLEPGMRRLAETVAAVFGHGSDQREAERVFLEGTSNIVDEQKFADLETVRQVIETLEHRRLLLEVLADALSGHQLSVRIGAENAAVEMQSCSVVAAPFGVEGEALGSLGVVGPTRMDYRRTIAAVHEVATNLGRMLTDLGA